RFASAATDGTVRIWSLADGKELKKLTDPKGDRETRYTALALCPDGRRAVTGSYDGVLRVWDLETGQVLARYSSESTGVNHVAVSPDGKYAISGGGGKVEFGKGLKSDGDYQLRLWRLPIEK